MTRPRARDLGLPFPGRPGPHNAITDVPGVLVGFSTLVGEETGRGVCTGVTAILPRGHDPVPRPVWAGFHALNGNGEMTGVHWINDGGYFVGPVCLTNTHSVGTVHQAAVRWTVEAYRAAWTANHLWAMPVVAETYDGVLNDINGFHVREEHALAALRGAAPGAVAEGNVGGGTGMVCYEFKGGTGTSSRAVAVAERCGHVAALVQANHGVREWLTVLGAPIGRHLAADRLFDGAAELGSIIVVLATDLPLLPHQLRRLAKRATIGIGRGGTPGGNNSGDIFLAFSTANPVDLPQLGPPLLRAEFLNDELLDPIYLAAVEAVEEAVVNALVAAEDTPTFRPLGRICRTIPRDELVRLVQRMGPGGGVGAA
jgi:D-aminopeptidase